MPARRDNTTERSRTGLAAAAAAAAGTPRRDTAARKGTATGTDSCRPVDTPVVGKGTGRTGTRSRPRHRLRARSLERPNSRCPVCLFACPSSRSRPSCKVLETIEKYNLPSKL